MIILRFSVGTFWLYGSFFVCLFVFFLVFLVPQLFISNKPDHRSSIKINIKALAILWVDSLMNNKINISGIYNVTQCHKLLLLVGLSFLSYLYRHNGSSECMEQPHEQSG